MNRCLAATFKPGSADGFTIDGNDPGRDAGHRGDPGDEAALELLGIEGRKDIAEMIVRRRSIAERPQPAQEANLFLAKRSGSLKLVGFHHQARTLKRAQDVFARHG